MTVFVLSEDRPEAEPGLRLAIASLSRHAPDCQIICHKPWQSDGFDEWARRFSQLKLVKEKPKGANSWNCKPHALLPLLEKGVNEAVWVDSDMLVTRDSRLIFRNQCDSTIVVAEEPFLVSCPNAAEQAAAWGWQPGRKLRKLINSSIVRVTCQHLDLLHKWKKALESNRYLYYQSKPFENRPRHMLGDQDVLFSLLGTKEFSQIPIRILRDGTDILHCGGALGYSFTRRLGDVFKPKPTFLHAIAGKPWWIFDPRYEDCHNKLTVMYRRLLQEISPYTLEAKLFRDMVDMPLPWMDQRSRLGRLLEIAGFRHHALMGLPISIAANLVRILQKIRQACVCSSSWVSP